VTFLKEAPQLNPARNLIKGVVCGVRVEDVTERIMRDIRYMDKLIDELQKEKRRRRFCGNKLPGTTNELSDRKNTFRLKQIIITIPGLDLATILVAEKDNDT
jgi:hypothetical protein